MNPAGVVEPRRAICNSLTRDGDLAYAGQVRFGFAGKGLWASWIASVPGLHARAWSIGPALRVKFGRRSRLIRDGVVLGLG